MRPLVLSRAFAVHVFTASGAALALGALIYAVRGQWTAMFVCLGIALIVDGVDGTFARTFRVADLLPRWSGDVLDLVVDFTTYVFVPAYALNNLFGKLPLLGPILGGGSDGGLVGVTFAIDGPWSSPVMRVNPLSAVAPGFLRKIFEFRNQNPGDPNQPQQQYTPPNISGGRPAR